MIELQVYDGVTQVRMSREMDGKPVYWVAAYLIDGMLVDTGCSHTSEELAAFLEGKDLRFVVNTHYHEDHIGGNHDIMTRYGIDICAPSVSIPLIGQRFDLYPYQEIAWGYPVPTTVKPVPPIIKTDHYEFKIIETPGHSNDHICLVELSRGWCFSGDLFARETPKFIRPEENIGEIMQSMNKIIELPMEKLILFTAVGKIIEDGRKALKDCIAYLTGLAERVKGMERSGSTLDDIVNKVFGGENPFAELTSGQFSTNNLVRSLLKTMP